MPPLVARIDCPGQAPLPLLLGERLAFGRTSAPQVDLPVSESPRVSRRAGTVEATPYGVLVTNTGSNPLLLDEPGVARRTLRPGNTHLVVNGNRARVSFAATSDAFEFEVHGGQAVPTEDAAAETSAAAGADRTRPAWALAEGTAYHLCLVALCEPTLRYPESPWIPTSQQVADRLYDCGLLAQVRRGEWVDRRLDDVRAKLPIGERAWTAERARRASAEQQEQAVVRLASGAPRRGGRKEQLVEFAVGHGIVTLDVVQRYLG
ncbi:MAG: hypothetical protein HYR62_08560 [Actinobacteria bacterium]|nr:hypothetical protein [Actinomycetota bacterium]MBI3687464.1 hypothetical protein [Actinomycetota bacterium]